MVGRRGLGGGYGRGASPTGAYEGGRVWSDVEAPPRVCRAESIAPRKKSETSETLKLRRRPENFAGFETLNHDFLCFLRSGMRCGGSWARP